MLKQHIDTSIPTSH